MALFYMPLFSNKDLCQRSRLQHFQRTFLQSEISSSQIVDITGCSCAERSELHPRCQSWRSWVTGGAVSIVWKSPPGTRVPVPPRPPAEGSGPITMIGGVWPPDCYNGTRSLAAKKGLRKTDEVMSRFDLGIKLR